MGQQMDEIPQKGELNEVKGKIEKVSLDLLVGSDLNVRREIDPEKLCDSIKRHGIIHPITVRPCGDKFEVIVGRTRVEAARLAGFKSITARVVELSDKDAVLLSLHENEARGDINPLERALAYKKLIDLGMTQYEIACEFSVTQPRVSEALMFLALPVNLQQKVLKGELDFDTALRIGRAGIGQPIREKVIEAASSMTQRQARRFLTKFQACADAACREYWGEKSHQQIEREVFEQIKKEISIDKYSGKEDLRTIQVSMPSADYDKLVKAAKETKKTPVELLLYCFLHWLREHEVKKERPAKSIAKKSRRLKHG